MSQHHGFGIDIGGSGIKGAPVDLRTGEFTEDRVRIETPEPSTPEAVAEVVGRILGDFGWDHRFGCTAPGVVQHGVVRSAANIDKSWIGTDFEAILRKVTGLHAAVLNDADAAGLAEAELGAARHEHGVVLLATLGTGIGSCLLRHGKLIPNTELGHLELDGREAESHASSYARERDELSWEEWAARLTRYFRHVEDLLWPDLIVVGGGVSKKADEWLHLVDLRTRMIPAELQNSAGIVGAALVSR